jgi:hypothetical protein
MIKEILKGNDKEKKWREIDFDFMVCGEVLRVKLYDNIEEKYV